MQQNTGLPYSPSQIQFALRDYQPVNQIQLSQSNQQFYQAVPILANMLMREIVSKAQSTPLRTFMFNQLASQNFQGTDFVQLLQATVDYLAYGLRRNFFNSIDAGIQASAFEMAQFFAAVNTRIFPQLQTYADYQATTQVLQNFDTFARDLDMEKSRTAAYPGVVGGMQAGQQYNRGQTMISGFQQRQQEGLSEQRSGLFITERAGARPDMTNTEAGMRTYHTPNRQGTVAEQEQQQTQQSDPAALKKAARKGWVPTLTSPYRPAFSPSTQDLAVRKQGQQFIYTVIEGDYDMDAQRHRLTSVFGSIPKLTAARANPAVAMKALAEAVSDGKTTDPKADSTIDSYSRAVYDHLPIEIGYGSVWSNGYIEHVVRSRKKEDDAKLNGKLMKEIDILQWATVVITPVLVNEAEQSILECLCNAEVQELSEMLNSLPLNLTKEVASVIDSRMTVAVNRAIRHSMSIPTLAIDSFAEDWISLVNHVAEKYGNDVAAVLLANATKLIKTSLSILEQEHTENFIKECFGGEFSNDGVSRLQYFAENISCTLLNFISTDLDIDFEAETSALLTKTNTRLFYDLAALIFSTYGDNMDRHLVRTLDGRILEVSKGWLGQEAYLISLVK